MNISHENRVHIMMCSSLLVSTLEAFKFSSYGTFLVMSSLAGRESRPPTKTDGKHIRITENKLKFKQQNLRCLQEVWKLTGVRTFQPRLCQKPSGNVTANEACDVNAANNIHTTTKRWYFGLQHWSLPLSDGEVTLGCRENLQPQGSDSVSRF